MEETATEALPTPRISPRVALGVPVHAVKDSSTGVLSSAFTFHKEKQEVILTLVRILSQAHMNHSEHFMCLLVHMANCEKNVFSSVFLCQF